MGTGSSKKEKHHVYNAPVKNEGRPNVNIQRSVVLGHHLVSQRNSSHQVASENRVLRVATQEHSKERSVGAVKVSKGADLCTASPLPDLDLSCANLEEICYYSAEKALSYLFNCRVKFTSLLQTKMDEKILFLIFKILVMVKTASDVSKKTVIYNVLSDAIFLDNMNLFVRSFIRNKGNSQENSWQFFRDFVNLFEYLMDNSFLNRNIDRVERLLIYGELVTAKISARLDTFTVIETDFRELRNRLAFNRKLESVCWKTHKLKMMDPDEEPPDDYRHISLYPQPKDLEEFNFLRQNIISGSYQNVEHYLDVQFRLLREDFIYSLREGIMKYRRSLIFDPLGKNKLKQDFSIHMYKNVKCLNVSLGSRRTNEISYQIQLDKVWASQFDWVKSKRLLFGSLVLFTNDDFENFQLGIVMDRDVKKLQKGLLNVALVGKDIFGSDIHHRFYLMAESDAFFEPVYQTLKALQNLSVDNLAMQRYLLVKDVAPKRPAYLNSSSKILMGDYVASIDRDSTWPSCDKLGMNESQLEAFKAALRQEFVIIQGPPGTGKTFLGLRIVKTLLQNFNFTSPILMVAYTNHALDQFLEGMLEFTDRLIRIGGQCKTESLQDHNFQSIKHKALSDRKNVLNGMNIKWQRPRNQKVGQLKDILRDCYSDILEHTNVIKTIANKEGLIDVLRWNDELKLSGVVRFVSYDDILAWLIGDMNFASIKNLVQEMDNSILCSADSVVDNDSKDYVDEEDLRRREYFNSTEDLLSCVNNNEKRQSTDINLQTLDDLCKYLEERVFNANLQGASDGEISSLTEDIGTVIEVKSIILQGLGTFSSDIIEVHYDTPFHTITLKERWQLYNSWTFEIQQYLSSRLKELRKFYDCNLQELKEIRSNDDLELLRALRPQILGLTTTGASRLHPLLQQLAPQIIIIEEAAEVLEAHVVASLTSSCQHLILIGDHKQLKPNPSTYELAKKFKLDVSLFERMVNNNVSLNTLNVQHRMKPNIASLLTPTIYENLVSHPSVHLYPPVLGVTTNLFFIHHNFPEKKDYMDVSWYNTHEASFMISLCTYLLQQGYTSSDIVILTTYSKQQFLLAEMSQRVELLKGVRITVVDNYQGEECKIILLSLVRNNSNGQIGFLSAENRICVALSRAKHGMYIMGNMTILKAKSDVWCKIDSTLRQQDAIDETLRLVCRNHGNVTVVMCTKDFSRVKHGGCSLRCSTLLECGHTCIRLCHPDSDQHLNYKCQQPCNKTLCTKVPAHKCPLRCYEECVPCEVMLLAQLPGCGHQAMVPCHLEPFDFECPISVNKLLGCGHTQSIKCCDDPLTYECHAPCKNIFACSHACRKMCYEKCGHCSIKVSVTPTCGHSQMVECGQMSKFVCAKRCKKVLSCGHVCKKLCHQPCGKCLFKVDKILYCGHKIEIECWRGAESQKCRMKCQKVLGCGHTCGKRCGESCFCFACHKRRQNRRVKK